MTNKLEEIFEQLIPYIILGITIAFIIGFFIMLSYVLVWGILLGAIIWLVVRIKNNFFPSPSAKKNKGRIIEHDNTD